MVDVYGAHETRLYYVEETSYGQTPSNPSMLGIAGIENVEPGLNPGLIKLRGIGSYDLQAIKKGLRQPTVKIAYILPESAPIDFLQYAKVDLNKSLTVQVLYYKGVFTSATDIISLIFTGCKFQRVTVQCSIEDVIKANTELWGQNLSITADKIAGTTYTEHSGAIPYYESYVKKDTMTLDRVTDWSFTIENNLKRVPVIRTTNGYLLKYLPHRHRNLRGEITFEFESKEEFEDIINDAEFSLEFGLGGSHKAVFTGCKWENVSSPSRLEDLVACKVSFAAKGPVSIS